MKLIDLVIVFIIIIVPFCVITIFQNKSMEQFIQKQIEMNHILDAAVTDGVAVLVENGDGYKIVINKELCVSTFYQSLFVNLNITLDEYAKTKIKGYIPVIIILDYDGYYALSLESFKGEDDLDRLQPIWQPKKVYAYQDDAYIYGFTMDDFVTVYCKNTDEFHQGRLMDLKPKVCDSLLSDEQLFDEVRRRTIIETLQDDISRLINEHNEVARGFGITYQFTLPVIEEEEWYQTVDNIGMLVFFQGLPTGIEGTYYNQYAFGGAQILKGEGYYIQEAGNGLPYYHRDSCTELSEKNLYFRTPEECALEGAFPCEICKP